MKKLSLLILSLVLAISCTLMFAACRDGEPTATPTPPATSEPTPSEKPDPPETLALSRLLGAGAALLSTPDTTAKLAGNFSVSQANEDSAIAQGSLTVQFTGLSPTNIEDISKLKVKADASLTAGEDKRSLTAAFVEEKLYLTNNKQLKLMLAKDKLSEYIDMLSKEESPEAAVQVALLALTTMPEFDLETLIKSAECITNADGTLLDKLVLNTVDYIGSDVKADVVYNVVHNNDGDSYSFKSIAAELEIEDFAVSVDLNVSVTDDTITFNPEGFVDFAPFIDGVVNTLAKADYSIEGSLILSIGGNAWVDAIYTISIRKTESGMEMMMNVVNTGIFPMNSTTFFDGEMFYVTYEKYENPDKILNDVESVIVKFTPDEVLEKWDIRLVDYILGTGLGGLISALPGVGGGDSQPISILDVLKGINFAQEKDKNSLILSLSLNKLMGLDEGAPFDLQINANKATDGKYYLDTISNVGSPILMMGIAEVTVDFQLHPLAGVTIPKYDKSQYKTLSQNIEKKIDNLPEVEDLTSETLKDHRETILAVKTLYDKSAVEVSNIDKLTALCIKIDVLDFRSVIEDQLAGYEEFTRADKLKVVNVRNCMTNFIMKDSIAAIPAEDMAIYNGAWQKVFDDMLAYYQGEVAKLPADASGVTADNAAAIKTLYNALNAENTIFKDKLKKDASFTKLQALYDAALALDTPTT